MLYDINNELKAAYDSTSAVTNYAQATITAVPRVTNPPSWFGVMEEHLQTVQEHANNWLKKICPAVTHTVPCSVIQFSQSFDASSAKLLDIIQAIESLPGEGPTDDQRQQVDEILTALLEETRQHGQEVQSLQGQISDFFLQLAADHTTLSDNLNTAQAMIVQGKAGVQKLQAVIGEDFITSEAMGPCHTIVEIKIDITLAVQVSGVDPGLVTLVFAEAILKNMVSNQANVIPAIQNILDLWTTLAVKIGSVITDLQKMKGEDYTSVLKQIDLMVAWDQWKQAADYAAWLYGNDCSSK